MIGPFGKLYEQTFTGSMYGKGAAVFALWAYVVSHVRPPGLVEINPSRVADEIGAKVSEIEGALEYLMAPDLKSRSKSNEGRRLLREGEFIFRVPTFDLYRNGDNAERKAKAAARQARYRKKKEEANRLSYIARNPDDPAGYRPSETLREGPIERMFSEPDEIHSNGADAEF